MPALVELVGMGLPVLVLVILIGAFVAWLIPSNDDEEDN